MGLLLFILLTLLVFFVLTCLVLWLLAAVGNCACDVIELWHDFRSR